MIELLNSGVYLQNGTIVPADANPAQAAEGREKTMAYSILRSHDISKDPSRMRIRFDGMLSHDITYVGIIQTARGSGLTET